MRAPTLFIALLVVPIGVCAQETAGSPDLFSLTFAPGPFSDEVLSRSPDSGAADAAADDAAENGSLDRLLDEIAEAEQSVAEEAALNAPQSRAPIDLYRSLAALYQDPGNPLLATAALEQASAVIRMSDGSLDQAAIVEQTIETLESVGAFSESDALQDELLDLARKGTNESDQRVPSILATVADRQMEAVQAYLNDDVWPRARVTLDATAGSGWEATTHKADRDKAFTQLAVIADDYDSMIEEALADDGLAGRSRGLEPEIADVYELVDTANDYLDVGPLPRWDLNGATWEAKPPAGDRELAIAALHRARRLYSAAMQAAYRQGNQSEYGALGAQLVETYYFEKANPELETDFLLDPRIPSPLASVLRARVADRLTRGAPEIEVARASLELGDALGNHEALDLYQDTYDFLVRQDLPAETLAELFYPEIPVIRRSFGPEDSRHFDPSRGYRGYIDVQVETGRYGQTMAAKILDSSPGTTRPMENRLRKRVSQTRFRPRFVEGRPVRSDRFAIRYYYDYDVLE